MLHDNQGHRQQSNDENRPDGSNQSTPKGFGPQTSLDKAAKFAEVSATDLAFYKLWLTQPSWSPIILTSKGWRTTKSNPKKVPLNLGTIQSHYRRGKVIGKRHSRRTNYFLIDVDIKSPFHPYNGGLKPILDAMESIGLCRFILVRSSDSEGLHIYFPLPEPVNSYALACTAHTALAKAKVKVKGGICELFPNRKRYNAEYNGHRLPLQPGSYLLDSDFQPIGNSKAVFLTQWHLAAAAQDMEKLNKAIAARQVPVSEPVSIHTLPPIVWTNKSESNEVMKQLVNYGDRYLGLNTIEKLAEWVEAVAPQLPGFDEFASEESKDDLSRYKWAYRWSESHFKYVRKYLASISSDHNAEVSAEAKRRLMMALREIGVIGKLGIGKLWKLVSSTAKRLLGTGVSWKNFQKYRGLILASTRGSRNVGLSRGHGEGNMLPASEMSGTLDLRGCKKPPPQLITPGCGTCRETGGLNLSHTLSESSVAPPEKPQITPAVEPTIKATAAQLLKVLGQACPFVGPGLWEISQSAVPASVWAALLRLDGSS